MDVMPETGILNAESTSLWCLVYDNRLKEKEKWHKKIYGKLASFPANDHKTHQVHAHVQ